MGGQQAAHVGGTCTDLLALTAVTVNDGSMDSNGSLEPEDGSGKGSVHMDV